MIEKIFPIKTKYGQLTLVREGSIVITGHNKNTFVVEWRNDIPLFGKVDKRDRKDRR